MARVASEMAGRKEFKRLTEQRRREGEPEDYAPIRRDWFLGGKDFGNEILGRIEERRGPNSYGAKWLDSAGEQAEWTVRSASKRKKLLPFLNRRHLPTDAGIG
jgi:hypothetical protein